MVNIYQVEFVNNTNPNNVETLTRFYVADDIGKVFENIKNDKKLDSFTVSYIHNFSNTSEVILL